MDPHSVNNSPGGPGANPDWAQTQSAATFGPQSGMGYVYADYNSATGFNNISNYLISPLVTFSNGDTISFWTRTVDVVVSPDRLELTYNTDGSTAPTSFTNPLITINPNLTFTGYPSVWTQYSATISGLAGPTSGRFAFWYNPTTGGPFGNHSDYIGVDDVSYTAVPGPASLALVGLGVLMTGRHRR